MTGERSQVVDIMRALAVALVVLGHALIFCGRLGWLMRAVYGFHMPLMFSISGYVAAMSWRKDGPDVWARAGRKVARSARRLLVPYAFFALLVVPLVNAEIVGDVGDAFVAAWRNALVLNRSLWFLPCCFLLVGVHAASRVLARAVRWPKGLAGEAFSFAMALLPVAALYALCPRIDYFRTALSYAFSFFAGVFAFGFLSSRSLGLDAALARLPRSAARALALAFLALVALFVAFPLPAFKPLVGLASLVPVALLARAASLHAVPPFFNAVPASLSFLGQSTLVVYCLDFIATPLTIRYLAYLNQSGALSTPLLVLLTFLYVPLAIALFCFLRLAWLENMGEKSNPK